MAYLSSFVDCIEINSSFYRIPTAAQTERWIQRACTLDHPGFFFTAKLHRGFTHEQTMSPQTVRTVHEGFEPMLQSGRLKTLLAQFRYDFKDTAENRHHLAEIVAAFDDAFELAIELRDHSWTAPEALAFLRDLDITVCHLDYPKGPDGFELGTLTIGLQGYYRLHGRNHKAWYSKAGRDETYNYLYEHDELEEIATHIRSLAEQLQGLTIIANNHYRGAELANCLQLKTMLTGKPVDVPETLLRTYPRLKTIRRDS